MHNGPPAVQVLVPVKPLTDSKLRLATLLTPAERAEFTLRMLEDVLANLAATPNIANVAVVSSDPDILHLARRRDARVIVEAAGSPPSADALNEALAFAAGQLPGATPLMVVPGDVPLVDSTTYAAAIEAWPDGIGAVRSHDGGTNALLSPQPGAIPYRFGAGSLELHRAVAAARQLPFHILEYPLWARDIDSPDDLVWLAQQGRRCSSAKFAEQLLVAKDILKRSA